MNTINSIALMHVLPVTPAALHGEYETGSGDRILFLVILKA